LSNEETLPPEPQKATTQLVVSDNRTGEGRILITPAGIPNIVLRAITPLFVIVYRAVSTYLQSVLSLVSIWQSGFATGVLPPPADFFDTLQKSAYLSIPIVVMSVLKNVALFLTELGEKFPKLKA